MKKRALILLSKLDNIKPGIIILILLVWLVGQNIYKQVFAPITINGENLRLSKKNYKTIIEKENEEITKTLIKIERLTFELDSCKYVLDSVLYRKRSNLDSLQRWFNHY